jgi:D-hydroxyproline dehydrogenase subunit beta
VDAFDLVVVGAGIVGLAHALHGAERGWRVAVVERDARCVGASIRNFGFVTVTGQRAGTTWQRALRSRDHWARIAPLAGIRIEHRGLWLLARRPKAAAVLEAFARTPMGERCTLHDASEAAQLAPTLATHGAAAAMYSPHELRVESRDAIPRLAAWLASRGVRFFNGEAVLALGGDAVHTATRRLRGERIVVCPGTDLSGVAAGWLEPFALKLTRLQMLRLRPEPGFVLPAAVMSDLSLVRYAGYAALPEAAALRAQLEDEVPQSLADGIHLIAVQSADGTLVVGDSHHDDITPEPFASEAVDERILSHLREAVNLERLEIVERWTGVYPTGHDEDALVVAPDDRTRVVVVTSGTGASTAFGLADEVLKEWT